VSAISLYEAYYRDVGLAEYEGVFAHSDELEIAIEIYASRTKAWKGANQLDLRVLDIGCGLGTFTSGLLAALYAPSGTSRADARLTIDAIDINPEAFSPYAERLATLSRPKVNIGRTLCAAWQDVGSGDLTESYDLVITNHVFYGCPCDLNLLKSVVSLLKPGGLVLLALSSQQSDVYRMRRDAGIQINCAEDLTAALTEIPCNLTRIAYESKLRFDPTQPQFFNWLFATSTIDRAGRNELISRYSKADGGLPFLINRALIYIIEAPTLPWLAKRKDVRVDCKVNQLLPVIRP